MIWRHTVMQSVGGVWWFRCVARHICCASFPPCSTHPKYEYRTERKVQLINKLTYKLVAWAAYLYLLGTNRILASQARMRPRPCVPQNPFCPPLLHHVCCNTCHDTPAERVGVSSEEFTLPKSLTTQITYDHPMIHPT